jgi:thymidylate synthase (FAD)
MKLIKPSFEIIEQQVGLIGIYKQIELAGRICYKSEDKITDDSSEAFVQKMVDSKHYAMLEHGTVYLKISHTSPIHDNEYFKAVGLYVFYKRNSYSKVVEKSEDYYKIHYYITTNYRVIVENNRLDDLQYLCEPTEYHERRHAVHFTADAGVMREFFRHRVFSMAQESTRYCNYSKAKFDENITCIIPYWSNLKEGYYGYECETSVDIHGGIPVIKEGYLYSKRPITTEKEANKAKFINDSNTSFINSLTTAECCYFKLLESGWKPQQARNVLPLAIKAEGIMTGFASDWRHFCDLRAIGTTGAPHPQAKELAEPLMDEFINRKYI